MRFSLVPRASAWRPHALVLALMCLPVLAELGVHNGSWRGASAATLGKRPSIALDRTATLSQVSPDGRIAVVTMTEGGNRTNPTHTILLDLASGRLLDDVSRFTITRDGASIDAADAVLRDLTFSNDSNVFYASLTTGARTYRVRGDIGRRELVVVE